MQTIFVSPDFPLNRRMRKAVRRGKLQVVREGGERLTMGREIPPDMSRTIRTFSSPLVCMADNGAESGGLGGGNGEDEEDNESEIGFEVDRKSAREIFEGRVQFQVPIFQRDYVWGTEQWEDFWADVVSAKPKYGGGIVLRDIGRDRYEVIDGQQRLTTVCLFAVAALRTLHNAKEDGGFGVPRDHAIFRELADAFLVDGGDLNSDVGRKNMKIVPHDSQWSGDGRFLSELMKIHPQARGEFSPFPFTGNTPEIQMKKSVKHFFMGKMREHGLKTPEAVRDFVLHQMGGNLVFSRIVAAHNEEAHAIFETLNGRGRALTPAELIKSYFMSHLSEGGDVDRFESEWNGIRKQLDGVGLVGQGNKERGDKELVGFVWAVHVCKFGPIPRQRLFREIVKKIQDARGVHEFFGTMKEQISAYVQILDPTPDYWGREFDKVDVLRHCSPRLSRGRSPFIMAARHRKGEDPDAYSEALGVCAAVAWRIRICGRLVGQTNNLQAIVFNRLARNIWKADKFSADILEDPDLPDLYHPRADLERHFKQFTLSANGGRLNKNQLSLFAYALRKLEEGLGGHAERMNGVVRSYPGNMVKHRLSEYCLQQGDGDPMFQTTEITAQMSSDERGEEFGKWAAEKVDDWRIDRFEDE